MRGTKAMAIVPESESCMTISEESISWVEVDVI